MSPWRRVKFSPSQGAAKGAAFGCAAPQGAASKGAVIEKELQNSFFYFGELEKFAAQENPGNAHTKRKGETFVSPNPYAFLYPF